MTEKVEKSLAHSHPQILREHTLWDYYNYWGGNVIFLVQGLHVLQAASAPPCGLSIVVHTTGTETIMTELSWFLFSFGHHCLSQFWSPFLPPYCKIVKSLLYLYFLLLPWLVKVRMAIIRHFPLKFRYLFIYQLFTICSCVQYFTCSS